MEIKEKIEIALSYEASLYSWRNKFMSEEFQFCSRLNKELFGMPFNNSKNCECVKDFFLLLRSRINNNSKNNFMSNLEKKYVIKKGMVIQSHNFPKPLTSLSSDEDCKALLRMNERYVQSFETVPADWKEDIHKAEASAEDVEKTFEEMNVEELKAFAEKNLITLTAKKKADIVKEIEEAVALASVESTEE